jgi:dipeptidyl aminopeptidase/acylaminoacyl peptidase
MSFKYLIAITLVALAYSCQDPLSVEKNVNQIADEYVYYNLKPSELGLFEIWRVNINDTSDNKMVIDSGMLWSSPVNNKFVYYFFYGLITSDLGGNNKVKSNIMADYTTLSPNGRDIIYYKGLSSGIDSKTIRSLNRTNTDFTFRDESITNFNDGCFSPDGNLFYTFYTDQENIKKVHLGVYNFTIGNYNAITDLYLGAYSVNLENMSVSPDGSKIALFCQTDTSTYSRTPYLSILDLNTNTITTIDSNILTAHTEEFNYMPQWTPDGSKIVYLEENGEIVMIDSNGANKKVLTRHNDKPMSYSWIGSVNFKISKDGSKIVFVYANLTNQGRMDCDIKLYDINTGTEKTLVKSKQIYRAFFGKSINMQY